MCSKCFLICFNTTGIKIKNGVNVSIDEDSAIENYKYSPSSKSVDRRNIQTQGSSNF